MDLIKCQFCDERHDDDHDWHETKDGDMACETCQYDASAHFGQMRDNIRHTRGFDSLIYRWADE